MHHYIVHIGLGYRTTLRMAKLSEPNMSPPGHYRYGKKTKYNIN